MRGERHTDGDAALPPSEASPVDFESLFQVAPIGLAVLDADLRYVRCNDALAQMNGLPEQALLGRTVRDVFPEMPAEIEARLRTVFRTGEAQTGVRITGRMPSAPDRRTWVESMTPLRDSDGKIRQVLVGVQELPALLEAETSLRATERALKASQQLSPDGLTIIRAVRDMQGAVIDFVWEHANPAAQAIMGQDSLVGRRLSEVLPGSREHPDLFQRYARLLTQAEASDVELSYDLDGKVIWFSDTAVAIDSERVAIGFRNISRRKQVEEQTRLVSGEYRHRVKNLIAVVAGLVSQQARFAPDVPQFANALLKRLDALAGAQDLLAASDAEHDVPLERIVQAALDPFEAPRLQVDLGPPLSVRAGTVTLLTLALHELATNAVKHGALSVAGGSARLNWTLEGDRVELTWSEMEGPPVSLPEREGYGSRLLTDAARSLPRGVLRREFRPEGVRVTIAFDLAHAQ
jgi:two-component system CheB/CheR fusion protein